MKCNNIRRFCKALREEIEGGYLEEGIRKIEQKELLMLA